MKKLIFLLGTLSLFLPKNFASDKIDSKIKIVLGSGTEYKMSLKEAERELHKLARNSYTEDAWMYHDGTLTDVGMCATKKLIQFDIERIFSTEYKPEDTIYIFHIHPKKSSKMKINPPTGLDFFLEQDIKRGLNLKEEQVISKVFDGIGRWTYRSNDALMINPEFSHDNEDRYFNLCKSRRCPE